LLAPRYPIQIVRCARSRSESENLWVSGSEQVGTADQEQRFVYRFRGLWIREDKNLMSRFLRNHSSIESIRKEIEGRTTIREKVSTFIDLPLSNECKRILAYAAEEAERLMHRHIGTEHLLLGILREEKCRQPKSFNSTASASTLSARNWLSLRCR
jgi:ATP-dependent Clp protease ATP-binding subunit ClpA